MRCRTTPSIAASLGSGIAIIAAAILSTACGPEGTDAPPMTIIQGVDDGSADGGPSGDATTGGDDGPSQTMEAAPPVGNAYVQVPEWSGPCNKPSTVIDVNLGSSPESFVTAAYCQINGKMPTTDVVTNWANQLRTVEWVRRIDVVHTLCNQANRSCILTYSNPWQTTVLPTDTCTRKTTRDVGAVWMFFFNCPLMSNCTMDWANTHAWGMAGPDLTYGYGSTPAGLYSPGNVGFWLRELLDARWAGLQFMLPNEYGPDTGYLGDLEAALTALDGMGGGIKVGLFNDTSAWGKPSSGSSMNPAPSLSNTQSAAQQIYTVQWEPFFKTISKPHWYTVNGGQPLIYFYNAGTLTPSSGGDAVVAAMKQMFMTEFGVTPFVVIDRGYCPTPCADGDGQFVWDTFANYAATNYGSTTTRTGGLTFTNSMVKWDSLGRDQPGAVAMQSTRMIKGPQILQNVLSATANADLLLLETWNDLGEGTGITRNYDYYHAGAWLQPDAFMSLIRASQCSN
jgi:hypothetical protein